MKQVAPLPTPTPSTSFGFLSRPRGLDLDHDTRREFIRTEKDALDITAEIYESSADDTFQLVHVLEFEGVFSAGVVAAGDADGDGLEPQVPKPTKAR